MDHRILRFRWLDRSFYAYLQRTLDHLPEAIRERVLSDSSLEIIGDDDLITASGRMYRFHPAINHLIVLNPVILRMPETAIVENIAHEIAHFIAGKGETGLYEKEAAELLEEWGFPREQGSASHQIAIMECAGFKAGYRWASHQDEDNLIGRFGGFLTDWNRDRLTEEQVEELLELVDSEEIPGQVVGTLEPGEGRPVDPGQQHFGTIRRAVTWGVMAAVKEIILRRRAEEYQEDEARAFAMETVDRMEADLRKLESLQLDEVQSQVQAIRQQLDSIEHSLWAMGKPVR